MSIELFIQSGPQDNGRAQRLDHTVITIGRDPTSTLLFDMASDLEVSTRHAEIRQQDGQYAITDKDSTNGTFVNGGRVRGWRILNVGDVINLGHAGPELRVVAIDDQVWHKTVKSKIPFGPFKSEPPWRTPQRISETVADVVGRETRTLKLAVGGTVAVVLLLGVLGWYYLRSTSEDTQLWREVTAPAIQRANEDAVVLVETDIPGSCTACEGTGFSISPEGLIVTNRHVVVQKRVPARFVRVKFANTRQWLRARVLRVWPDATVDVALLQVEPKDRYPTVVGLSQSGADLPVGSAVMTMGFPLGTGLRMEGSGASASARTTVTMGAIAKLLPDVIQIDAFADHGSSGSPVFDRHGHAVGVVSGGARDDVRRIVYVVPSNLILQLRDSVAGR